MLLAYRKSPLGDTYSESDRQAFKSSFIIRYSDRLGILLCEETTISGLIAQSDDAVGPSAVDSVSVFDVTCRKPSMPWHLEAHGR